MKSKPTLKQIAIQLGYSVSTVSKALSDSPEIGEETKTKIKEFAKLSNYKPNSMAQNLKRQRTNTIGVIIPNILNPFFAKVFSGIEKFANAKGYNVITYISNESFTKEKQAMDLLSNGTVDGFILSIAEETQKKNETSHFKEVIREGIPIVMFDRISDSVDCDKVVVDDYDSAVHATQHLITSGCQRIALLTCEANLSVSQLRINGYLDTLKVNRIAVDNDLIIAVNDVAEFDVKLANLIDNIKVDGIFALDEHASTLAMKLAVKKGIKIPDELSMVGFADGAWSRRLTPSLATISQHGPEIGAEAAKLLIERIENKAEKNSYKTTVIKTELRYRDSVRKPN
ncbi:LacI family transcriptional regulator [Flavobacterium amnicola]|uniref:LacI family transcriptional regulator n=1 Tax=Flavobacterium amnicola TaxID=2506422 RepID=A0A4Q1K4E9_9FLAO|nr:LacI family DNA-binding transcriptional regulator [Flavobacterium amnicola]RXR20598.1 LacI family transcriptional regulator [Flavobacterium amnicola]